MKKYSFLIFLIVICSCCGKVNYSKDKPIGVRKIGDNLYREMYQTYAGNAFTSDSYTVYLTDSLTFRVYVGTVNQMYEQFIGIMQIDDDNVLVYKTDKSKLFQKITSKKDTVEKKIYSISALQKEGKFE